MPKWHWSLTCLSPASRLVSAESQRMSQKFSFTACVPWLVMVQVTCRDAPAATCDAPRTMFVQRSCSQQA